MSKNDITGDKIQTKSPSAAFDEGFERIFGKKIEDFSELEKQLRDAEALRSEPFVKKKNMLLDASLPKPPPGYTEEELERDNPHNQWMYENAESTDTDPSSKR